MENIKLEVNTLFLGDRSNVFLDVKNLLIEKYGEENLSIFEVEKLNISIDDVRAAINFASYTSERKKVIMFSSFFWGIPAQNSMLKFLEETPENTTIFLFGLSSKYFLPTVLSRVQKKELSNTNRYAKVAKEVLSLNPNERLENKQVKKILSLKTSDYDILKDEEGGEKKDREAHIIFLQALMGEILKNKGDLKLDKSFLEKVLQISTLADIDGGSPHLFIEWLLLSTPKVDML